MIRRAAGQTVKRGVVVGGAVLLSLLVGASAEAAIIELTPANTTCTSTKTDNLDAAEVLDIVDDCFGATGPLTLLYKAELGGADEGTYAAAYETTFSNSSNEPQDATIQHLANYYYMDCSACYLVVKDGEHQPGQYLFNISSWNGTDTIQLTGFWPEQGAISNVAIWGRAERVPEPTTLLLVGTGLGLVSMKRRRLA